MFERLVDNLNRIWGVTQALIGAASPVALEGTGQGEQVTRHELGISIRPAILAQR